MLRDCLRKELGVTPFLDFLFHQDKQFIHEIRIGFSISLDELEGKIGAKQEVQMFNFLPTNLIQTHLVGLVGVPVSEHEHEALPKAGGRVGAPKGGGAASPIFMKALKDLNKNKPPKNPVVVVVRTAETKVDFSAPFLFETMSNMESYV